MSSAEAARPTVQVRDRLREGSDRGGNIALLDGSAAESAETHAAERVAVGLRCDADDSPEVRAQRDSVGEPDASGDGVDLEVGRF